MGKGPGTLFREGLNLGVFLHLCSPNLRTQLGPCPGECYPSLRPREASRELTASHKVPAPQFHYLLSFFSWCHRQIVNPLKAGSPVFTCASVKLSMTPDDLPIRAAISTLSLKAKTTWLWNRGQGSGAGGCGQMGCNGDGETFGGAHDAVYRWCFHGAVHLKPAWFYKTTSPQ